MGADSAAGWKALAELQYQTRQWQNAYTTSCTGLEWSVKRRHAGHETLTAFALSLRLCAARCLRRLNRLEEAEAAFKVLAGTADPPPPPPQYDAQTCNVYSTWTYKLFFIHTAEVLLGR